ncbi:MAG: outer membrane lipoprotein-sorting protein [Gammaproteobacteria bacterium]|nr:outer membrane lipoprotein-sorting protein [Gammaproteobacteria bacterium]
MFRILMLWLFVFSPTIFGENDQLIGLNIAKEADLRDSGWVDMSVELVMTLRNTKGETNVREMRLKSKEIFNDGDKTLMVFDTPHDVKGTGLLTYTHLVEEDDQWLYLPALKRVKRIASKNKSGPFVGSEFAYEDLSSQEVTKYTYKYLRDEIINGIECFVTERYPVDQYSGYTRQVTWIDKDHYRLQKVEYYDRKNKHLKTLTFKTYRLYENRFWRAGSMTMTNHLSKKSTELKWNGYTFNRGINDQDFGKNALKRIR